ncbi:lysine N-methyltransferase EEF2KMT [Cryptosporidium sp. chipmunk genotype I]|uniref:lysine N-methyltransferase EEF2KMT n=1 Tax=Cryptosporidium sp. chipmunk genotype I TaxID=1280935 RepID=UPI00351A502E|nr:lysine N-methyltransferase EEF2KMT [Cryptosporidium sp. chipmunk genotype I]
MNRLKIAIFALQPKKTVISICKHIGLFKDLTLQVDLVKNILNCEILKKYPLPLIYRRNIICEIIKSIESDGYEVSDELYIYLSQLMGSCNFNLPSHIVITFPNNRIDISLHGSNLTKFKSFVFGFEECNLVGMRPWSAGYRLVEWLAHSVKLRRNILNSDLIELGSGIGISSIIPYSVLPIKSICSTDYDPKIVNNLRYNFEINGITLSSESEEYTQSSSNKKYARVMCLDWETININIAKELLKPLINPIIISSDVIYDNDLTFLFVKTLKFLLSSCCEKEFGFYSEKCIHKDPRNKSAKWNELKETDFSSISTYAISVNTIRNQHTIQYFVDCCIENGLTISRDSTFIPSIFNFELDTSTVIFIISY